MGEQKLVGILTSHGSVADQQVLDEKGLESSVEDNQDVGDDFFMLFLLLSPSIEFT